MRMQKSTYRSILPGGVTAFKEYEMHRVSIGVVGLNTPALEFYRKIGFKQEGILEEAYYYNNEYSDFVMMRILSHEWQ